MKLLKRVCTLKARFPVAQIDNDIAEPTGVALVAVAGVSISNAVTHAGPVETVVRGARVSIHGAVSAYKYQRVVVMVY